MTKNDIRFFAGTWQERVFVAVASPLIGVLAVGGLIAIEAAFPSPSDGQWRIRVLGIVTHAIWVELFVAFLGFLSLAFLWAILRLRWLEECLLWAHGHVWHAVCLFIAGFLVSVLIIYVLV
jgi:hypothetical protein